MGKDAGATAIEIRGRLFGHDVNTISDDEVRTLKGYLTEFGMRVAVIGSGVGKCHLDKPEDVKLNIERFRRMTELAHLFDTNIIRVFGFWNPYWKTERKVRPDLVEIMPQIRAAFEPIVAHAEKEKVYIAFEPEGDTNSGNCRQIRQIIDGLGGSRWLGIAWDVNNAAHTGEMPLPDGYTYVKGRVRHLHVKPDKDRSIKTVANTPVSYRQVFDRLIRDSYDGPASVEHWGSPEGMLDGIRQTRALLSEMGMLKQ
jgi:sugar phosphate isomerase/epimerase